MDRHDQAAASFETQHRDDPAGAALGYHERLLAWVLALDGGASEALRLAARCQHIRRWEIPRRDFPEGLSGYKRWRSTLARHHAVIAEAVLTDAGYDAQTIARVKALLMKKGLGADRDVQLFEDAICLTFIERELEAFADKHDEDKLVSILRKTWKKMSPAGHAAALSSVSTLPTQVRRLIERALADNLEQ